METPIRDLTLAEILGQRQVSNRGFESPHHWEDNLRLLLLLLLHVLFAVRADQDVAAHLMATMLSWGQFTKASCMPS